MSRVANGPDENLSLVQTQAISLKKQFADDYKAKKKFIDKLRKLYEIKEWSTSGYETFDTTDLVEWAVLWAEELCQGVILRET